MRGYRIGKNNWKTKTQHIHKFALEDINEAISLLKEIKIVEIAVIVPQTSHKTTIVFISHFSEYVIIDATN
jgi:hypothetical protein